MRNFADNKDGSQISLSKMNDNLERLTWLVNNIDESMVDMLDIEFFSGLLDKRGDTLGDDVQLGANGLIDGIKPSELMTRTRKLLAQNAGIQAYNQKITYTNPDQEIDYADPPNSVEVARFSPPSGKTWDRAFFIVQHWVDIDTDGNTYYYSGNDNREANPLRLYWWMLYAYEGIRIKGTIQRHHLANNEDFFFPGPHDETNAPSFFKPCVYEVLSTVPVVDYDDGEYEEIRKYPHDVKLGFDIAMNDGDLVVDFYASAKRNEYTQQTSFILPSLGGSVPAPDDDTSSFPIVLNEYEIDLTFPTFTIETTVQAIFL